ncbi:MAG: molybdopterin-dependent oxidoreductase [Sediminimonas sp.]|uniref:molybdopterin-dependent oxidoreductase n=1 Tax=Sediminimonas sp. TaxID=2823379 RepID=UPI00287075A1|nr:molybdopterin-dependent oxidoreductase [Sediminimonas sp.]MDR9484222.1 molybdopterin-dependent oxidoreductase [Sediminimonas sp.]
MRSAIDVSILRLAAAVILAGELIAGTPGARAADPHVLDIRIAPEAAGAGEEGRRIALGLDDLRTLPRAAFRTSTNWTAGRERFEGVHLHDLLAYLGVRDGVMRLIGLNGYEARFPVADVRPDGALLAFARNGAPMSIRDKGPLWLVFPFDRDARYRTETYYARSVWQLDRIRIER